MNVDHRASLESYFRLVDERNWDDLFALFHPEVVYRRGGTPVIRGIEEFKEFYLSSRQIESGRHEVDLMLSDGDWAATKGTFHGVLRDGRAVQIEFADFHRFRDGLIWRRDTYFMGESV